MLPLLFSSVLLASWTHASPSPDWHYPRQVANASITPSASLMTSTAGHNCSWTWSRWLSESREQSYNYINTTVTYTYHNLTASVTTECDGVTRIVGDLTTVATGTNTTFTQTTTNYTVPAPTCTPAPEDCAELGRWQGTYPCPRPTTSVAKQCGQCSIWGGTVDLIYFPITATTSHTLCPNQTITPGSATICPLGPTTATRNATNPYDYQPCYYATGNATSTSNSGPSVVSGGHTFYQNRAYISLQTAYASDDCGLVGEKHHGTILELKSKDVYSVGGYHHEFQDAGYQFNFQDLEAAPSYAYYMDCNAGGPASCYYSGTRYTYGTDFLNGHSDIDFGNSGRGSTDKNWIFQEAYTPMLLLPTQIRDLDPAWATCSLNLGGLYDPPKALSQVAEAPGPTAPGGDGDGGEGTTAAPGDGPTTPGPTPTALPGNTPTTTGGGDDGATGTPDDPEDGNEEGGNPGPTTPDEPDQPTPTGESGEGDNDDGTDQPAPNDPTPTSGGGSGDTGGNDGQNGGGSGGNDDGQNGGGDGDQNPPADPTPTRDIGGIVISAIVPETTTQNIGGIIASVIGETDDNQDAQAAPADDAGSDNDDADAAVPTPNTGDQNTDDSDDSADSAPAAPITLTDPAGSAQTLTPVPVAGNSDAFFVGDQILTAGGSAVEVNGVTLSAGSSGQIVAGTQVLDPGSVIGGAAGPAPTGADGQALEVSTVADGESGVFVVEGSTVSAGGDAVTVDGATITAGPSGIQNVDAASPAEITVSDEEGLSVETLASGSSGVYVVDGTTLSVGGGDEVVGGATVSAAATGVVVVDDAEDGSEGDASEGGDATADGGAGSATGSAGTAEQTGNVAASNARVGWVGAGIAGGLVAVLAL